jgi:N-acetylglucosaminyldiphosphoundecaprenol N-acetyl-beta-D-mannosaminyltransferase
MNPLLKPFLGKPYWSGDISSAADNLLERAKIEQKPLHVVTLTSEMVLHATAHPAVMTAILSSDFIVADTISLTAWLRVHSVAARRITGIDLAEALIRRAGDPSVALIGGNSETIRDRAAEKIALFGGRVTFSADGPRITSYDGALSDNLSRDLSEKQPQIILVAFGHGKQEWWISKIKKELNYPAIIVGVGGTLDVWGGELRRAPRFMRAMGLEWLWRLIQEPSRIRRIFDAVVVFPYRAFLENLI